MAYTDCQLQWQNCRNFGILCYMRLHLSSIQYKQFRLLQETHWSDNQNILYSGLKKKFPVIQVQSAKYRNTWLQTSVNFTRTLHIVISNLASLARLASVLDANRTTRTYLTLKRAIWRSYGDCPWSTRNTLKARHTRNRIHWASGTHSMVINYIDVLGWITLMRVSPTFFDRTRYRGWWLKRLRHVLE